MIRHNYTQMFFPANRIYSLSLLKKTHLVHLHEWQKSDHDLSPGDYCNHPITPSYGTFMLEPSEHEVTYWGVPQLKQTCKYKHEVNFSRHFAACPSDCSNKTLCIQFHFILLQLQMKRNESNMTKRWFVQMKIEVTRSAAVYISTTLPHREGGLRKGCRLWSRVHVKSEQKALCWHTVYKKNISVAFFPLS